MGGRWGRAAVLSTLLTCLFLGPGFCSESDIKESLGKDECEKYANKILWISGKTSALIVGKNEDRITKCQLKFGLATRVGNARLRLFFDHLYIEDCGIYLQINQSVTRDFKMNQEMFFSACNTKNPGPLYAQPKNFVLINLVKVAKGKSRMEAFNFRLNISMAEELPVTGIDFHIVLIVGFVMVVLVGMAAVLLYKFASRLSYNWREQRVEEAMTRAINVYNSREPIEEPDLVYIRPGLDNLSQESTGGSQPRRGQSGSSEIAFVHPDGRVDIFRPRDNAGRERTEVPKPSVQKGPKGQTRRGVHEPRRPRCLLERDGFASVSQPASVSLDPVPPRVQTQIPDLGDTASVGGCDMPPSYEEALEMPVPSEIEDSDASSEAGLDVEGDENISITGRLEVDYMNVDQNVQGASVLGDRGEREREDSEACDSVEALLPVLPANKAS